MEEVWKDIQGYEGIYQVSNLGNVRSVDRCVECVDSYRHYKGRIMRLNKRKNGYLDICLRRQDNKVRPLVHRLVAEAFIPNPEKLPCVNHKDENKENNRVDNLEWCTEAYNNNYGESHKQRSIHSSSAAIKNQSKPVLQYSLSGEYITEYYSAMEAGRKNNCRQSGISECCNGKQKTAYGYIWRYKEAE